jgi:hypothetical protein
MLTKQQQDHLDSIIQSFSEAYIKKYTAGAIEHGGFLGDMPPLELAYNLFEEGMDTVAYALTLIDKLKYHEE